MYSLNDLESSPLIITSDIYLPAILIVEVFFTFFIIVIVVIVCLFVCLFSFNCLLNLNLLSETEWPFVLSSSDSNPENIKCFGQGESAGQCEYRRASIMLLELIRLGCGCFVLP